MMDEFDEDFEQEGPSHAVKRGDFARDARSRVARLVARLYGAADRPLRGRMLACLSRPLGSLGLAGVASGAFAALMFRRAEQDGGAAIGDLADFSSDQIFELARFVEQVSPSAIQQLTGLLADNPISASAFSASVVMLLVRAVRAEDAQHRTSAGEGSTTALDEMLRRAREKPASN
jgi:hypothetical protein